MGAAVHGPARLLAGTEPADGERLALPVAEQTLRPGLGNPGRDHRGVRQRMALPHRRSRPHPINRLSPVGVCHSLGGLVLERVLGGN